MIRSTSSEGRAPYLTIVSTGRNDSYGGNFEERFLRTLRFNAEQLQAHGVGAEFVFVEWAAPAGRPLLSDLARDIVPSAAGILRAYVVDAAYQEALTLNRRVAYLEFIAKNVGIRRARGEFILTTNADVFLGRAVLETLARRALEPGNIYRARRIDLKLGIDQTALDWDVLEDPRNYDGGLKPLKPPLYAGGTGDFVLADPATFARLRGFNEVFRVAKIGIDRNFLVKALHAGVPIVDIGAPVYHINHVGSYRASKAQYRSDAADAPYGDDRWPAGSVIYENPDNWGLGDAPIVPLRPGSWRLPFHWNAVPPLVELARVAVAAQGAGGDEDE
jgi:hypothetical protein